MIDVKTLKALVELMSTHDLTEVDIETEGETVKLKRGSQPIIAPAAPAVPAPVPVAAAPAPPAAAPAAAEPAPAAAATGPAVESPMVGTFYTAPTPDDDAFVKVGDKVTKDTVVCIIEAMKVFNEIKAEASGTIAEILVNNGDAVEFGQPLFRLQS